VSDSIAYDVYSGMSDAFAAPIGWDYAQWRSDLLLACGLTALAVESALLDIGHTQLKVLRDPRQLKVHLGASSFGILGCSYSGRAAEVLDGLAAVRAAGLKAALVSNNRAVNPEIVLPDLRQPRALQHIAFTVVIQRLLHSECPPKIANLDDDLPSFLETVFHAEAIPIFVTANGGFQCRALLAYWLEFLHRPGFAAQFPDWTHDLLWAATRPPRMPLAFLLEEPLVPLSNDRFANVLTWVREVGYLHLVLPSQSLESGGQHVGFLLACATMYHGLATRLGVDIETELQFHTWGSEIL